jgi:hypothetical protein
MDHNTSREIVLDDIFSTIGNMRPFFNLALSSLSLEDIEKYPGTAEHIAAFLRATIDKHSAEIYIRPDVINLGNDTDVLEPEPIGDPEYPRFKIRPQWQEPALREVMLQFVQTIGQLPPRFPKSIYPRKSLKSILKRTEKSASELLELRAQGARLDPRFSCLNTGIAGGLTADFEHIAKTLKQCLADASKVQVVRINPVNPQVSLALYVTDFFEFGTDLKRYALIDSLTEATFTLAGKPVPKWVGRLAVETARKKKIRKAWIRSITGRS